MQYFSFPDIDPYIIKFGVLGITWYSLSYVIGIIIGWKYCNYLIVKTKSNITLDQLDRYISIMIIAIIVGGRLGHVIFYEPFRYLANPIEIVQTYMGGMSFHGGLIGVGIASYFFCKKNNIAFFNLTDLLAQGTPFGLFFGRIANFINGELYGHPTESKFGIIFPGAGDMPRHPSQLYEAFLEGVLIFSILAYLSLIKSYHKKPGALTGVFLLFYGIFRSFVEFFRVPDYQIFIFTSGQLLSLPMIILGIIFIKNGTRPNNI
jgi:phosphatidylglycerol---prolipoprotein diacylglyceryl transferase